MTGVAIGLAWAPDRDATSPRPKRGSHANEAVELCVTRRLSEASFAKAHSIFGDEVIAELLMLVGCYYGLALVLNAVDVEVDAR